MLVLFGGNIYGAGMDNARLRGCDPDLWNYYRDWQANFWKPATTAAVLGDQTNIASNVRAAIAKAVSICDKEPAFIHDSSHGTWLNNDGALVCYDSDWNDDTTFVTAQDLRDIVKTAPAGGRIYLTIDACTFGNSVRALHSISGNGTQRSNRFIAPDVGNAILNAHIEAVKQNAPLATTKAIDYRDMPQVCVIAGCLAGPDFTCADCTDASGNSFGAFTSAFVASKRAGMTAQEIVDAVNKSFVSSGDEQRAVASGGLADKVWGL